MNAGCTSDDSKHVNERQHVCVWYSVTLISLVAWRSKQRGTYARGDTVAQHVCRLVQKLEHGLLRGCFGFRG